MAILGNKSDQSQAKSSPVPPPTAPAPTAKPAAASPVKAEAPVKKTATRKPLVLNLDGLSVSYVTDRQEMAKSRRQRGERSTEQKKLDALVESAWIAWKEKGRPTEWTSMPGVRLRISESNYDTLVAGIRKAGNFFDLKVRFGAPTKGNGNVEIVFVVTDRPEKDEDDSDDEIDNEA